MLSVHASSHCNRIPKKKIAACMRYRSATACASQKIHRKIKLQIQTEALSVHALSIAKNSIAKNK